LRENSVLTLHLCIHSQEMGPGATALVLSSGGYNKDFLLFRAKFLVPSGIKNFDALLNFSIAHKKSK